MRITLSRIHEIYFMKRSRKFYRTQYLQSDHWADLRRDKLRESPFCERCEGEGPYDVHHIRYKKLYDYLLSDLQTLCRKCHETAHAKDKTKFQPTQKGGGIMKKWKEDRAAKFKAAQKLGRKTGVGIYEWSPSPKIKPKKAPQIIEKLERPEIPEIRTWFPSDESQVRTSASQAVQLERT